MTNKNNVTVKLEDIVDEDVTPTMANIKALEPNTKLHIDTITICK